MPTIPFVIRDDDLSATTDLEKLQELYEPILARGFKISFATIPHEQDSIDRGDLMNYYQTPQYHSLGGHKKLVDYICTHLNKGTMEVMLHGYTHTYQWDGKRFIGECLIKSEAQLRSDFTYGKRYLEKIFGKTIESFVPPSNHISASAVRALKVAGIKYLSGGVTPAFNRDFTLDSIRNWLRNNLSLLGGHRYPHPMRNGCLHELTYYALTPQTDADDLQRSLDYCIYQNAPFVLATHHWEIWDNPKLKQQLLDVLDYAEKQGVAPALHAEAFRIHNGR